MMAGLHINLVHNFDYHEWLSRSFRSLSRCQGEKKRVTEKRVLADSKLWGFIKCMITTLQEE
jgi:hypothetical protein